MRFLHPASQGSRALLARASVLTTAALLLGAMLAPAMAATTTKPYEEATSPLTLYAGQTTTGSFQITNDANPQTLGSADITPPSGLTVTGVATDTGAVSVSGGTIELRNLNLAPSATVTVSYTIAAACGSSGGPWITNVKQSNAFNGPPGNDFILTGPQAETAVSGTCTLAFGYQPANAAANTDITSVAYDPTGQAVTVGAYDGSGAAIDGVTISIATDPGSNLSGATATTDTSGSASFSNLKIDASGSYQLVATSPGFQTAYSDSFTITDTGVPCAPGEICTTSEKGTGSYSNTSSSTTSTGLDVGGYLAMSMSQNGALDACSGYTPTSNALITIDVTTGNPSTATIEIDKVLSGQTGVSSFQVCFSSDSGEGFYLLPDCTPQTDLTSVACVLSRTRSPHAKSDVLITFSFPAGDPKAFS